MISSKWFYKSVRNQYELGLTISSIFQFDKSSVLKTQQAMIPSKKQFYTVDLLRGLSAIVILVWHYHHFFWSPSTPLIQGDPDQPFFEVLKPFYTNGYWAVELFWLISGFVFSHVYSHTKTSVEKYFIFRFSRLYPLHFLTLCLIALVQFLAMNHLGYWIISQNNNLYHFMLNVLFVSQWGFQQGSSFNVPFWSVSIEEGMFIIFFLVHRFIFNFSILVPLILVVLGFSISQVGTPLWYFGICSWFFFSGTILHYLINVRWGKIYLLGLMVVSGSLIYPTLAAFQAKSVDFLLPNYFISMFLISGAILIDLTFTGSGWYGKICKWVSSLTYSSYLLHFPIQVLILFVCASLSIETEIFRQEYAFIAWMIFMVVVSRMSYVLFEYPIQTRLRAAMPNMMAPKARVDSN